MNKWVIKLNYKYLFAVAILFYCNSILGQQKRIDSLLRILNTNKITDSLRTDYLIRIGRDYQNIQIDSSILYLEKAAYLSSKNKDSANAIMAYNFLAISFYNKSRLNEAIKNFEIAERYAVDCKSKNELIRNKGNIYSEQKNYNLAINMYKQSYENAKKCAGDSLGMAASLNNIAYVNRIMGNYNEAIVYLLEALVIFEKIKSANGVGNIYIQLALLQYRRKLYDDAEKYANLTIDIYTKLNNKPSLAIAYSILGGVYSEKKEFDKAIRYLKDALEIHTNLGDTRQVASTYFDLGELYYTNKNYNEALSCVEKSIKISTSNNIRHSIFNAYILKSKILIDADSNVLAAAILDSLESSIIHLQSKEDKRRLYETYVYLYKKNDFKKAYEYLEKLATLKDTIFNIENNRQISELQTKYEVDKKNVEIKLLATKNELQQLTLTSQQLEIDKKNLALTNQSLVLKTKEQLVKEKELELKNQQLEISNKNTQIEFSEVKTKQKEEKIKLLDQLALIQKLQLNQAKNFNILLVIGIIAIGLFSYFLFSKRKLQEKIKLQEAINKEQEVAAKNILAAEEAERSRLAAELHDGVGQIIGAALLNLQQGNPSAIANTTELLKSGYDELRSISHQMIPNSLLKHGLSSAIRELINRIDSNKLQIILEAEGLTKVIQKEVELVLYRVIQEAISNVIKHAKANKLFIHLLNDDESITITIEDNGVGFDKNNNIAGLGLTNMQHRIHFLKGTIDIESAPNKGTVLIISIPIVA